MLSVIWLRVYELPLSNKQKNTIGIIVQKHAYKAS